MRVLILGGTTEAASLARQLAGDTRFEATLSLAGRTSAPAAQALPTRIGGFGGVDGLVRYLEAEKIEAVVDATHPYAAQMSAHAVTACRQAGLPLASLTRAPWTEQAGDCWQHVSNTESAAMILGDTPRRVFLTIGRQELPVFAAAPQHRYLARLIDAPKGERLPPQLVLLQARGPFDLAAETALMRDVRAGMAALTELHRVGVQLAIDDFGTGYSSLSYLKRFPLDVLKVDRSFVDGIPDEAHDVAITTAILDLARSLDLRVTAEGVETEAQREALLAMGCTNAQGWLFGKAMPAEDLAQRLAAQAQPQAQSNAPTRSSTPVARAAASVAVAASAGLGAMLLVSNLIGSAMLIVGGRFASWEDGTVQFAWALLQR